MRAVIEHRSDPTNGLLTLEDNSGDNNYKGVVDDLEVISNL